MFTIYQTHESNG